MKNIFKSLMLVAVAAMGFTACQNEGVEEAVRPNEPAEVVMTITADVDATRTWIDEANGKVQWSESDALKVIENSKNYRTTTNTTITDGKAKFTVSFAEDTTSESFTYNAVYPATAVVEDDADKVDNTKVKVILKDAQKPTATSFDPTADILVSKQIVADAQPTELNMQFKRLVAIGKMTLTNLDNDAQISKVTFTAPEGKVLAGRNYVDATTGVVSQYGYHGATNKLTLSYDEAIATRDIYFTCNPFEMAGGDVFSVEIVCGDYTYTREVTIPAERSLAFTEGDLTTFTVNMAEATKEDSFVFPDGEYAIIAVNDGTYYAMTNVDNGASTKRLNQQVVTYDGTATSFVTVESSLKWTITAVEGGYTIQDVNDQYLSWTSGNSSFLSDTSFTLNIAPIKDSNKYYITANDGARYLSKNTSNAYFAFYGNTSQIADLFIVPYEADTTPRFEVTPNTDQSIEAAGGDIQFTVTTYNGAVVSATSSDTSWLTIDNTFKATAAENTNEEGRSATITFSAEGCEDVIIPVTQAAAGATVAAYVKVTSTSDITDGQYLIVYESGSYAFNGGLNVSSIDADSNYITVTISNSSIESNTTTDAAAFTYNSANKSFKSAGGAWIGRTGTTNGMDESTTIERTHSTVSINNDGTATITSSGGPNLQFYKSSKRFRYYASTQEAICLYKLNN